MRTPIAGMICAAYIISFSLIPTGITIYLDSYRLKLKLTLSNIHIPGCISGYKNTKIMQPGIYSGMPVPPACHFLFVGFEYE